jgi:RNA polymerase sigma-70 factor (ECF subfamily)
LGTTADEARAVLLAQLGDREALETVLRSVQAPLRGYVSRIVGATEADDVVQNTLIVIARKLNWLEEPRLFRAWAFRIASRAAFDLLKKQRRKPIHDSDEAVLQAIAAPPAPPPEHALEELLTSERISAASRAVLILHFQEEMPLAEVAAVLDLPLGTVKSRLAYGLKALRRELGDQRSL